MDIRSGLKEAHYGRQAARERIKEEQRPLASEEVFSQFQKLWEFLSFSPNYQQAVTSDLAIARRERTRRSAEVHAKLRAYLAAKEQNRAKP